VSTRRCPGRTAGTSRPNVRASHRRACPSGTNCPECRPTVRAGRCGPHDRAERSHRPGRDTGHDPPTPVQASQGNRSRPGRRRGGGTGQCRDQTVAYAPGRAVRIPGKLPMSTTISNHWRHVSAASRPPVRSRGRDDHSPKPGETMIAHATPYLVIAGIDGSAPMLRRFSPSRPRTSEPVRETPHAPRRAGGTTMVARTPSGRGGGRSGLPSTPASGRLGVAYAPGLPDAGCLDSRCMGRRRTG